MSGFSQAHVLSRSEQSDVHFSPRLPCRSSTHSYQVDFFFFSLGLSCMWFIPSCRQRYFPTSVLSLFLFSFFLFPVCELLLYHIPSCLLHPHPRSHVTLIKTLSSASGLFAVNSFSSFYHIFNVFNYSITRVTRNFVILFLIPHSHCIEVII